VLHARALPGNPYDGHTLGGVIEATKRLTGCPIERAYVDKGVSLRCGPPCWVRLIAL
jgi:transposase, IS5 family